MFITTQEMDIYDGASRHANIVGQVSAGQEISVQGQPLHADGWVWYEVQGGGLWIQERSEDGRLVLLVASGSDPSFAEPALPNQPRVFITTSKVVVRDAPSFNGKTLGETAPNQRLTVEGEPVSADGWVWHKIIGVDALWVTEKDTQGANVMLVPEGSDAAEWAWADEPQPNRAITPPPLPAQLGENIDIDLADYERTKYAAFAITRAFEGGGFASYNNYDSGVVSYGIMQFTLGSGSLDKVLMLYLSNSQSITARTLQAEYAERIRKRDAKLRYDERLRELLSMAASEAAMQSAQFSVATTDYWDVVMRNYVQRRGNLRYPLTYALLFDMGIHFGVNHPYARLAEESLGVPANSRVGNNGITEKQLTSRIAELRRDAHYRQADKTGFNGLRVRGDFWVKITAQDQDWYLQGDAEGNVMPKSGRNVQVRNPF